MRRFLAPLVALLIVAAATFAPSPAIASGMHASTGWTGNQITRWDETYDLQPDGSARVTLDFDFDFGDDPGHGPYFTFPTHQGYDDTYNRVYDYSDMSASSSTGAPANVYLEDGEYWLVVKVGDADQGNISGKQTYTLKVDKKTTKGKGK